MYRVVKSVDVSFAHHIRGHQGACINIHGHTWKLEVVVGAETLTPEGFVVDFSDLKKKVLEPAHALLDHALAIGETTWSEIAGELETMGVSLLSSREAVHGSAGAHPRVTTRLGGAENRYPGGLKIAVFPFAPTSERLAEWLYGAAKEALADERVSVVLARVYETLHPVHSIAEYSE
jgi:6-pyruvoyl tetrahydropterin synthase/QueD family protein